MNDISEYEPHTLQPWTRPENYWGEDWYDHFVFLGRHRDSDTLTNSNFDCGLKAIGGESETVFVVREGHWAVGWVEWIAIHKSDLTALETADGIAAALEDYPVVDEEAYCEQEYEEVCERWQRASLRDRAEWASRYGISIFAARRDTLPEDPQGLLFDYLRTP